MNPPLLALDRVSVVIPAFNRVAHIAAAIRSSLCQSAPPDEVIVVDDGSKDGTADFVDHLAREDTRIRCVRQAKNGGPAAARNVGVAAASGNLIAFLDSDDRWEPDFLATATQFLYEHPDIGMVFGDMQVERIDGSVLASAVVWNDYKISEFVAPVRNRPSWYRFTVPEKEAVLHRYLLPIQATVIRRPIMLSCPFDESCRGSEDVDLFIRLGRGGVVFGFIRQLTCHQIIHDSNILSNNNDRLHNDTIWAEVWEKALRDPTLNRYEAWLVRRQISSHFYSIGYAYSQRRAIGKSLAAYARSFYAIPSAHTLFAAAKSNTKQLVAVLRK